MIKWEAGNAEVDLRSRNMSEVLEALRGSIMFVKKLHPTHVPRKNHTCNGLVLPKWFVEDNMESLCKSVVLVTNTRAWDLRFAVTRCDRVVPAVVFCGGWAGFAISNNLAQGDQLIFKYSGTSKFDAYIFNADGTPKTVEAPMNRSEVSEPPEVKVMQSSGCKREHMVFEERKPSVIGLCGYFVKEEIEDQEKDADEYSSNRDHAPREKQKTRPSFSKRLTLSNFKDNCLIVQEIPAAFARTHGSRLQSPVKLQGIFEESAVCTVTCRWEQTRSRPNASRRLFLVSGGWKEFRVDNMLEVEQELVFTLVSDSYFVARKYVNPP